jgi:acetyl esterase/lipase
MCAASFPGDAQESTLVTNVVYAFKDGMAMYYDVEVPTEPNGKGIIFVVSGGWHSGKENLEISRPFWEVLLTEGYTIFELYHPGMPTYKIPDAYDGAKQGLAHILENADDFGVSTDQFGLFGISSGGHLALMLGMDAARGLSLENSIGAVVTIMAPAEITFEEFNGNVYGASPVDFDLKLAPELSPVNFISPSNSPTLLIHGTEDEAVSFENHSARLHDLLTEAGVETKLVSISAGHQIFPDSEMRITHNAMIQWFGEHLQ